MLIDNQCFFLFIFLLMSCRYTESYGWPGAQESEPQGALILLGYKQHQQAPLH